jgi:hypothetical protein
MDSIDDVDEPMLRAGLAKRWLYRTVPTVAALVVIAACTASPASLPSGPQLAFLLEFMVTMTLIVAPLLITPPTGGTYFACDQWGCVTQPA